jgi:hypothetical protein
MRQKSEKRLLKRTWKTGDCFVFSFHFFEIPFFRLPKKQQKMLLVVLMVVGSLADNCERGQENITVEVANVWCCGPKEREISFQVQALFQATGPSEQDNYTFFIGYSESDCRSEWTLAWQSAVYRGNANQSVYVIVPLPRPRQEFAVFYGYKNANSDLSSVSLLQWYVLVDQDFV